MEGFHLALEETGITYFGDYHTILVVRVQECICSNRNGHLHRYGMNTSETSPFLPRSIREWNKLPPEAVAVRTTLDTFVPRVSQPSSFSNQWLFYLYFYLYIFSLSFFLTFFFLFLLMQTPNSDKIINVMIVVALQKKKKGILSRIYIIITII